ncbi:zinc ribbon domain-containing protein [Rhodohalobacter sp. SW132]|uniref:FmdB family zinc ribbon protein n=1 Tax=Rhodohalobacter sp. SW132 TaxID=2293433 RepID=UPI000E2532A8|nr:zinc ribbon domain-containing protein [Rhodohalobacter sp. SW132]REL24759.1 zinc ribbon domain-containing protein [Rhodohalobacter sp. SW132]
MPTYEYKREDGTTFEVFQSMSDDALTVCPTTGQPVKRMISGGTGLVFKGSGFYVTDYNNGSKGNGSSETKESSSSSSSTAEKPAGAGNDSKSND